MASLEDFNNPVVPTLDELNPGKDVVAPVVSKSSNLNLAAYTAGLTARPEDVVTTYQNINAELDTTGQSELSDELLRQARQKALDTNRKHLIDVLASPDFTDEQKQQVALSALDEQNSQYEVRNMFSVEALTAPVKNESPRAETQRVDTASVINKVNEYKKQEQALLNAELAKESGPMIRTVAEVLDIIVPFSEAKMGGEVLSKMRQGDATAYAKAITMLGESKLEMREIIARTPIEDRLALTQSVINIINESETIVMPDGNDFAKKTYLQQVLDTGGYDNVDRWIDNIISVLDLTVLGGPIARGVRGTATAERVATVVSNTQKRLVKSRVQPTSVAQNLKDTNPDKAKAAFEASVLDESGEVSQAFYGSTKEDAIANDMLPEMLNADGTVMAKVSEIEKGLEWNTNIDPKLMDFVNTDGAIYAFTEEKAQAIAHEVSKFKNVIGMSPRKEMFQIEDFGGGVNIRAVYGPTDGGFSSAEDAINMAQWALRDTGVEANQIKLMARDGSNYRVVEPDEFDRLVTSDVVRGGPSGAMGYTLERQPRDFLVVVDHQYTFRPGDVTAWSEADVKYNLFDRMSPTLSKVGLGSLQRHLVDAHSMINPRISLGANVAVDKAAGIEKDLLRLSEDFATSFAKADPELQKTMRKLIDEANEMGKEHSYAEMVAAGLRDTEIQAMKDWRRYWDNIYYLENRDLAKSLNARGFMEYIDTASDTRLIARPISSVTARKVNKVYDPKTGEVSRLTEQQIASLYEQEGTLARLRAPLVVGDDAVEHILTFNKPGGDYLKAITSNTQVLNYRKGYYSVHYKDPYFVVEKVKDSRGNVLFERAFASAGSKRDAEALAKAKAANEGRIFNDDFYVRGDLKQMDVSSDDYWDMAQVQGRSAQKIRGKRLESADTNSVNPEQMNIMDPVDSMIVSARSISHRTAMRDMIETTKSRFLEQYKEFLPTDEFGQKVFPSNKGDVMYRGGGPENAKKLADARTTHEYIKYLEDGYINHIDEAVKAGLKVIADIAGNAGWDKIDKFARWMASNRGPSAMLKNIAFNLYLATNPLRQLIVQGHQAVQLVAFNPSWVLSKRFTPQVSIMVLKQMGHKVPEGFLRDAGWTAKQADEVFDNFRKSGQVAAIDKQNLVRGALVDLSDRMNLGMTYSGRAWKVATAPITLSRKVGFDAGEYFNMMTSYLAHYDDALKKGLDVSKRDVVDEIAGRSRNFTYNMNAAGDMPYNQNFLAAVFQFMQVPHKAMLGMTTNRVLSPQQKLRLFGFNATMFTLPPAAMYSWFGEEGLDILPDDPQARDMVVQGLEGAMLNKLLSLSSGEDTRIDWSGLSPMDMYGTMEFVHSLFTTDIGTVLSESPGGQLFFGNNPRLTNFAKMAARHFNVIDDFESPTEFGQVALEFAKLSSGFSNAFKAAYALEYNKKYGTMNLVGEDNTVPTPEAIALAFGFQSLEDAQSRYVSDKVYKKGQAFEDDVNKFYRETKAHLISREPGISQSQFATKVLPEAMRVFGNGNVEAMRIINRNLTRDLEDRDARLYERVMQNSGILNADEFKSLIKTTPFKNEEQRQRALDVVDFMNKYKEED